MGFIKYRNIKGDSGVTAYEAGADSIKVVFNNTVYLYTYNNPGKKHVEKMKELAKDGRGLSTYISRNVKDKYEKKYTI